MQDQLKKFREVLCFGSRQTLLQKYVLTISLSMLFACGGEFGDFQHIGESADGYSKFRHTKTNEIYIKVGKSFFKQLGLNKQGYHEYEQYNTGIIFVWIPAGNVELVEEDEGKRIHELAPFMVMKNPVTTKLWEQVMDIEVPTGGVRGGLLMDFAEKIGADRPWLTIPMRHYLLTKDFGVVAVENPFPLRPIIEVESGTDLQKVEK